MRPWPYCQAFATSRILLPVLNTEGEGLEDRCLVVSGRQKVNAQGQGGARITNSSLLSCNQTASLQLLVWVDQHQVCLGTAPHVSTYSPQALLLVRLPTLYLTLPNVTACEEIFQTPPLHICILEAIWSDAHLPARNGLVNKVEFLGLIPKSGNDQ